MSIFYHAILMKPIKPFANSLSFIQIGSNFLHTELKYCM